MARAILNPYRLGVLAFGAVLSITLSIYCPWRGVAPVAMMGTLLLGIGASDPPLNGRQRMVLSIGAALCAVNWLYCPWEYVPHHDAGSSTLAGYSWRWQPPVGETSEQLATYYLLAGDVNLRLIVEGAGPLRLFGSDHSSPGWAPVTGLSIATEELQINCALLLTHEVLVLALTALLVGFLGPPNAARANLIAVATGLFIFLWLYCPWQARCGGRMDFAGYSWRWDPPTTISHRPVHAEPVGRTGYRFWLQTLTRGTSYHGNAPHWGDVPVVYRIDWGMLLLQEILCLLLLLIGFCWLQYWYDRLKRMAAQSPSVEVSWPAAKRLLQSAHPTVEE